MNRIQTLTEGRSTMHVELRRVTFNERMSEETNCFAADLWINGAKVGDVRNQGQGGPTMIYIQDANIAAQFEAYAKSLPARVCEELKNPDGTSFTYEMNGEYLVDDLFSEWMKERELKRIQTWLLKQKQANFNKGFPFTGKCNVGSSMLTCGFKRAEDFPAWIQKVEAKHKAKPTEAGLV